ncbi:hypothetical protein GE061_001008 [Apolygus lucorum]|uniref:Uncharacterized protein n=1 Tax=Apolygus lucorum TaxID=248454 RepID=A0A8S9Y5U9_APOLU|nr:hypothetical protein GE061_001008 [Apolygus lucorum]
MKSGLLVILVQVFIGLSRSDETDEDCSPQIAERCFKYTWPEIYSGKGENYICGAINDDILCAQDIIDDGCRKDQGRDNFDSWISGLAAVYSFFCNDQRYRLLHDLLQSVEPHGNCFNLTSFVSCVESKTKVTHVTDMLYVTMDAVECNWIMISFATCGSRVGSTECLHVQEIISEALQVFFQEAGCANIIQL